jgi:hypothetical protein
LVAELLNFPGGKLDILNALAYSLRMFAGQPVYEDFGEANIGPAPSPRQGEKITLAWNASQVQVVCAAIVRVGRHFTVSHDFACEGPMLDCVRSIAASVRAAYPRAQFESYAPAELHDTWQRIALVPALMMERLNPWRAEHTTLARGKLVDKIRTTVRDRRLLSVSKDAPLTLNSLAGGYKYPVALSGKSAHEPESGLSRLVAEALECAIATMDRVLDNDTDVSGHFGFNAQGVRYRSALPSNPRRT